MNREIKLRAWNEIISEMVYEKNTPHNFGRLNSAEILRMYDNVMQFTGIRDKNGKEVYEGDLLSDMKEFPMILPVIYDEENAMFCCDISYKNDGSSIDGIKACFSDGFTVVGNIFENPELLKSGGEK